MTADLPSWAMEKAGAALGSPDFSRELLQIRVAYALVAERERAAGIAREQADADRELKLAARKEKDGHGAIIHAAEEAAACAIAAAILADGGPDAG